jgi:hypothetical protein
MQNKPCAAQIIVIYSPVKKIISARRQNNQIVFFRGYIKKDEMTEFQDLAFVFLDQTEKVIRAKVEFLSSIYNGLTDWKVEEIACQ